MDRAKEPSHIDEIVSLNADDLAVEELERRLELAVALPLDLMLDDGTCGSFSCGQLRSCGLTSCSTFGCPRLGGAEIEAEQQS